MGFFDGLEPPRLEERVSVDVEPYHLLPPEHAWREVGVSFNGVRPVTLADIMAMVPGGVPFDAVAVDYAGCGSHMVTLTWPKNLEPEPF